MNLSRREKQIIFGGIVCLGMLLTFQVLIRPALARTNTLERVVSDKQEILADLLTKSDEYNSLKKQLKQVRSKIESQQKDKKILSSIERIHKDCGLSQDVVSITPATTVISDIYEKTSVEIKYAGITLDKLTNLLLKINSSDMLIGIKSLEIKRGTQNPALIDAVIQLVSISNIEHN